MMSVAACGEGMRGSLWQEYDSVVKMKTQYQLVKMNYDHYY